MSAIITAEDGYKDKLQKLIPAEVSAAFLAIHSMIPEFVNVIYVYGIAAILVLACWLYMKYLRGVNNIFQLLFISIVAFPIWALNIAAFRIEFFASDSTSFIPAVLVILATVFAPLIIKAEA